MFGLGGGELFVVVLLAILLIGPKDLPKTAATLGRWYRRLKSAFAEFQKSVEKEISLDDGPPSSDGKSQP